jgi:hypothetical protein
MLHQIAARTCHQTTGLVQLNHKIHKIHHCIYQTTTDNDLPVRDSLVSNKASRHTVSAPNSLKDVLHSFLDGRQQGGHSIVSIVKIFGSGFCAMQFGFQFTQYFFSL